MLTGTRLAHLAHPMWPCGWCGEAVDVDAILDHVCPDQRDDDLDDDDLEEDPGWWASVAGVHPTSRGPSLVQVSGPVTSPPASTSLQKAIDDIRASLTRQMWASTPPQHVVIDDDPYAGVVEQARRNLADMGFTFDLNNPRGLRAGWRP